MKLIKAIIAIILVSVFFLPIAGAEEYGEFYPRLTVVVMQNGEQVLCADKDGNAWEFFSDDTWEEGDLCNLLMWNNSDDITQHEVIDTYWEGHIEDLDSFFHIDGWR